MYPYRQYITVKKENDQDLEYWTMFNALKSIPWAITRDRPNGRPEYTLWVWGEPLPMQDDQFMPPMKIHKSAIRKEGNGFETKLDTFERADRRA